MYLGLAGCGAFALVGLVLLGILLVLLRVMGGDPKKDASRTAEQFETFDISPGIVRDSDPTWNYRRLFSTDDGPSSASVHTPGTLAVLRPPCLSSSGEISSAILDELRSKAPLLLSFESTRLTAKTFEQLQKLQNLVGIDVSSAQYDPKLPGLSTLLHLKIFRLTNGQTSMPLIAKLRHIE